jgi:tRNA(Leu) C34 or U34 (ribose-2'-O)-methylase TrmL
MTDSAYSLLDDVQVVLLRPRWARNLGSVARAMKNFGLHKLTIVDSQIGSWNDAYQMAVQANDILDDSTTTDLTTALAASSWVVGTSNNVPPGTRLLTPREVAEMALERGAPTLLFGGEINGLDPSELLRCQRTVLAEPGASRRRLWRRTVRGVRGQSQGSATMDQRTARPRAARVDRDAAASRSGTASLAGELRLEQGQPTEELDRRADATALSRRPDREGSSCVANGTWQGVAARLGRA